MSTIVEFLDTIGTTEVLNENNFYEEFIRLIEVEVKNINDGRENQTEDDYDNKFEVDEEQYVFYLLYIQIISSKYIQNQIVVELIDINRINVYAVCLMYLLDCIGVCYNRILQYKHSESCTDSTSKQYCDMKASEILKFYHETFSNDGTCLSAQSVGETMINVLESTISRLKKNMMSVANTTNRSAPFDLCMNIAPTSENIKQMKQLCSDVRTSILSCLKKGFSDTFSMWIYTNCAESNETSNDKFRNLCIKSLNSISLYSLGVEVLLKIHNAPIDIESIVDINQCDNRSSRHQHPNSMVGKQEISMILQTIQQSLLKIPKYSKTASIDILNTVGNFIEEISAICNEKNSANSDSSTPVTVNCDSIGQWSISNHIISTTFNRCIYASNIILLLANPSVGLLRTLLQLYDVVPLFKETSKPKSADNKVEKLRVAHRMEWLSSISEVYHPLIHCLGIQYSIWKKQLHNERLCEDLKDTSAQQMDEYLENVCQHIKQFFYNCYSIFSMLLSPNIENRLASGINMDFGIECHQLKEFVMQLVETTSDGVINTHSANGNLRIDVCLFAISSSNVVLEAMSHCDILLYRKIFDIDTMMQSLLQFMSTHYKFNVISSTVTHTDTNSISMFTLLCHAATKSPFPLITMFEEDMELWVCLLEYLAKHVLLLSRTIESWKVSAPTMVNGVVNSDDKDCLMNIEAEIVLLQSSIHICLELLFSMGIVLYQNSVFDGTCMTYAQDTILIESYKEQLMLLWTYIDGRQSEQEPKEHMMKSLLNCVEAYKKKYLNLEPQQEVSHTKDNNGVSELDYNLYLLHTSTMWIDMNTVDISISNAENKSVASDDNLCNYVCVNEMKQIMCSKL